MTRRTTSASFSHPSTNPIAPYGPPVRGRTPHPGEARGEVVHELLEQPFARPRAPPIRRHPHAVAAEPSSTPHPPRVFFAFPRERDTEAFGATSLASFDTLRLP